MPNSLILDSSDGDVKSEDESSIHEQEVECAAFEHEERSAGSEITTQLVEDPGLDTSYQQQNVEVEDKSEVETQNEEPR